MTLIDLTGQRFGRLTVIKKVQPYLTPDKTCRKTKWLCQCDCGKETVVIGDNLKCGMTKSCGCLRSELSHNRLRSAYDALKERNETNGKFISDPTGN